MIILAATPGSVALREACRAAGLRKRDLDRVTPATHGGWRWGWVVPDGSTLAAARGRHDAVRWQ